MADGVISPSPLFLTPLPVHETWKNLTEAHYAINDFIKDHGYGTSFGKFNGFVKRSFKCDLDPRTVEKKRKNYDWKQSVRNQDGFGCPFQIILKRQGDTWRIDDYYASHNHAPSPAWTHPSQRKIERERKREAINEMIQQGMSNTKILLKLELDDPKCFLGLLDMRLMRTKLGKHATAKMPLTKLPKKKSDCDLSNGSTGDQLPRIGMYEENDYKPSKEGMENYFDKIVKKVVDYEGDEKFPKEEMKIELYKIPKEYLDDETDGKFLKGEMEIELYDIPEERESDEKDCKLPKDEMKNELYKISKEYLDDETCSKPLNDEMDDEIDIF